MRCGFGLGTCNDEATFIAHDPARWQMSMDMNRMEMVKDRVAAKDIPCCDYHRRLMGDKYGDRYTFTSLPTGHLTEKS